MQIILKGKIINPEDYGLKLTKMNLQNPKAKTNFVDVPFMDGSHDLTEANGLKLSFHDRQGEFIFTKIARNDAEQKKVDEFNSILTGQRVEIVLEDDTVIDGRIEIDKIKDNKFNELKINGNFNPYRNDRYGAGDEWLWNPFSFIDGIIYPQANIQVNGTKVLNAPARRDNTVLVVESSSIMKMHYKGKQYHISEGVNRMSEVVFEEGDNELKFEGTGTITLKYKGRRI